MRALNAFVYDVYRVTSAGFRTAEEQTRERDATTYNNFYEFGTGKADPNKAVLRAKAETPVYGCRAPGG